MARFREKQSELGILERADGSARLIQGETSVLCAIYGPAEVKISKEFCDKATVEVVVKPASGNSGPRERLLEKLVCSTCETAIRTSLHPHTAISITLQVENNAGSLLSVLVNACCLALMDACVPLTSVFSAVTCGLTDDGVSLVDPDLHQEDEVCQSIFTVVVENSSGDVMMTHATGAFTVDQLKRSLETAKECSKSVVEFYRAAISRKLSKDAKHADYFIHS